ncbi:MAG: hypothetical protein EOP06_10615 [Proteobacteria bacterium]|nr:MAG: hypothetical protein EOP06_10615 [Pseudomonadota bacterium]
MFITEATMDFDVVSADRAQGASPSRFDFSKQIETLARSVFDSRRSPQQNISLKLQVDAVSMSLASSMTCAVIVTELIENSLRHGFPNRWSGEVRIVVETLLHNDVMIEVTDTGVGLPKDFSIDSASTSGLKVVRKLVHQLGGKLRFKGEQGASFVFNFSDAEHA